MSPTPPQSSRRSSLDPLRRALVDRLLLWGGIAASLAAVIAGLVWHHPTGFRFFALYTAPLLLFGPLWLRLRLRDLNQTPRAGLLLDALVFTLAALRLPGAFLPHSGHALFLSYVPVVTPEPRFRLVAIALFAVTSYFKLWIWREPVSWFWGIGMGLALAGVRLWAGGLGPKQPNPALQATEGRA